VQSQIRATSDGPPSLEMMMSEFMPELKRTFNTNASSLSGALCKLACMGYQERFLEAVKLAGKPTRKALADAIGISVQDVRQSLLNAARAGS